MSLAKRSISSVAWNSVSNIASMVILFIQSVFLARWLPVEVFGIYALANAIIQLSIIFVDFGMGSAFLHRAPETENENDAAAVHFTIKLAFTTIWAIILISLALVFTEGELRIALLLLTVTSGLAQLAQTPKLILTRRVIHRRLALIKILDAFITTIIMLWLAWQRVTLWALLSSSISSSLLTILALYVVRPVWRPRLKLSPDITRYYLRFGSQNLLADFLHRALDRVDDLWTGTVLGENALGFYSRAYSFALYPRRIIALPIDSVAGGTYAELKSDRLRLSKAFFRTNALLIRSGFFLAGVLALIAPEFIRFFIGAKWLPMLDAFRLMLIYTLIDPIKTTIGQLFIAVGQPVRLVKIRLTQLIIMIVFLFILGPRFGISGVAIAVDIMLVSGVGLLLYIARDFVKFSLQKLFLVPTIALIASMLLARGAITLPGILGADWRTASVKVVVFSSVYVGAFLLFERHEIQTMFGRLNRLFSSSP